MLTGRFSGLPPTADASEPDEAPEPDIAMGLHL